MNPARKLVTFLLALLLSVFAWTCAEGQQLEVNPALEAEWFETWETTENEAVWCGYGMVWDEGVIITNHERATLKKKGATWVSREKCPARHENAKLVATIHTHPSLTQLRERVGRAELLRIKAFRKRKYGQTEYECELSSTDRNTFSEAERFGEGSLRVSIVVCAPGTYAYRMADNIYGGTPSIVVREENTDG